MWPGISAEAQTALRQSHGMQARATVYSPTLGVLDLPIAGGEVVADAGSQVRRSGSVLADPRWWPASPQDLLAPYGSEMQVDYGIVLPSGDTEWVPVGRLRLDEAQRRRPVSGSADVQVALVDRAARVAENRLTSPGQTRSGFSAVAEITRLVQETLPSVTVVDTTGVTASAAVLDIPRERWDEGVEKLASSIGAEVFFDPVGQLRIRLQPTLADPVVWRASTAEMSTLLSAEDSLSRAEVYNRVVAMGQRSDGTAPVFAVVDDTDPASPTYISGPFGVKPRFYASALLTTVAQCQTAGAALLARVRGAAVRTEFTALVHPGLEPGDVIGVYDGGREIPLILDRVAVPLSPSGTQPLVARAEQLPSDQ